MRSTARKVAAKRRSPVGLPAMDRTEGLKAGSWTTAGGPTHGRLLFGAAPRILFPYGGPRRKLVQSRSVGALAGKLHKLMNSDNYSSGS